MEQGCENAMVIIIRAASLGCRIGSHTTRVAMHLFIGRAAEFLYTLLRRRLSGEWLQTPLCACVCVCVCASVRACESVSPQRALVCSFVRLGVSCVGASLWTPEKEEATARILSSGHFSNFPLSKRIHLPPINSERCFRLTAGLTPLRSRWEIKQQSSHNINTRFNGW